MSGFKRFAVMASGRGSNFEALMEAKEKGLLKHQPVVLFTDQKNAKVIERAKKWSIPVILLEKKKGESRESYDQKIWKSIEEYQPDFLVLAGYMRVLSSWMIGKMMSHNGYSKIINIHPSLLPSFPGIGGYRKAFEYGARIAGVTVHLVNEGVDQGPICYQVSFKINDLDTPEAVEKRGLEIEHQLYPKALNWIMDESFILEERGPETQRRSFVRSS